MKFTLLIILFLAVSQITAIKNKVQQDEEGQAGDENGISRDTLMEYRILAKGTFSVAVADQVSSSEEEDQDAWWDDYAQFPNYCREQLDEYQFIALASKSAIYLDCWHAAVEVTDLGSCQDTLAKCVAALEEFEASPQEDDEEEGDEAVPEEEEAEEDGEECVEEDGEECEEESTDLDEYQDQEEIFVREDIPHLNQVQVACLYSVISANIENNDGSLAGEDALETEGADASIFKELTFHQDLRTNVSWLEFWLYMCNGDENILDKFDYNPLLESTERAKELIEELASDDDEEEARRFANKQSVKKVAKKAVKQTSKKVAKKVVRQRLARQ